MKLSTLALNLGFVLYLFAKVISSSSNNARLPLVSMDGVFFNLHCFDSDLIGESYSLSERNYLKELTGFFFISFKKLIRFG